MIIKEMLPGVPFSPITLLTQPINESATTIYIEDESVLPDAPNYATINIDNIAETIRYSSKTTGMLSGCTRGVEGIARVWGVGDGISRNWTNKDYEKIIANIVSLNNGTFQIAGTGLDKAGDTVLIKNTGVAAGTYTKLNVNVQGQVMSATTLSASDIPDIDWSKIATGKPTTLAGYGIEDATTGATKTEPSSTNGNIKINGVETIVSSVFNDNQMINGNFDFWQRGTSFTALTNAYGPDRWILGNIANLSRSTDVPTGGISKYSARVQANPIWTESPFYLTTTLENNFPGATVTLSFWLKTDSDVSISISHGIPTVILDTISTTGLWKYYSYTFTAKSGVTMQIGCGPYSAGKGFNLTQIKYEIGNKPTPFVPMLYGAELQLCQRYYEQKLYTIEIPGTPSEDVFTHRLMIPCVTKRINPTVTQSEISLTNIYSLTLASSMPNAIRMDIIPTNPTLRIFAQQIINLDAEI